MTTPPNSNSDFPALTDEQTQAILVRFIAQTLLDVLHLHRRRMFRPIYPYRSLPAELNPSDVQLLMPFFRSRFFALLCEVTLRQTPASLLARLLRSVQTSPSPPRRLAVVDTEGPHAKARIGRKRQAAKAAKREAKFG